VLPEASIVITAHNRAALLTNTLNSIEKQAEPWKRELVVIDDASHDDTDCVCDMFGIDKYFHTGRPPGNHYSNPARPNNIGIRKAFGDLLIIQNAECLHVGPVIQQFLERTKPGTAVFAGVEALTQEGLHQEWYTHSTHNPRPFFFCGAIHRDVLMGIRGFDEDYPYYGYDDNDMADRLTKMGVKFIFADDIQVQHQWHPTSYKQEDAARNAVNGLIYADKSKKLQQGHIGVIRNLEKEWGKFFDE
jgi:GT2 family glycosyltransferase